MSFVVWKDGKPYATNDAGEARRIRDRIEIIDLLLKEMGYEAGYEKYEIYVNEMVSTNFSKYVDFIKRVSELANDG